MANHNTVDILPGGNGQLGGVKELSRSNTASLRSSFPNTPDWIVDGNAEDRRKALELKFKSEVLDGTVTDGYLFSSFDRDYTLAPSLATVEVGAAGLPGNAWQPNTASPGTGMDPSTIPDPPAHVKNAEKSSRPPFVGEGTAADPSITSPKNKDVGVNDHVLGQSSNRPATWGSYNKAT